jgi:hypothetical protein
VCAKEKDLHGHVQRDANQRDEESCMHGKVILILSFLESKPGATTGKCRQVGLTWFFMPSDLVGVITVSMQDEYRRIPTYP